ncbi:MAG: hypothetical protein IKA10_07820 [Oscillospiraceae bacterium]|nr:hypothetical protein [Oscillospiraceae bacterium]
MKRTIIITLAMLIIFGGAVIFGAGRISEGWQKPQHDDVALSAVSPVERVNSELKEYSFEKFESFAGQPPYDDWYRQCKHLKADPTDGMLTYAEAAAQGGTWAEKFCTDLDLNDKTIALELITLPKEYNGSTVFCGYYYNEEETVYTVAYLIDAFTGKLVYLYYNAPHLRVPYTEKFKHIEEFDDFTTVEEKGRDIVYALGHSKNNATISTAARTYQGSGNLVESQYKTKDGTVYMFRYCADKENNYPLTELANCTVLFNQTEIEIK